MAHLINKVSMGDALKSATLKVKVTGRLRATIRIWLGCQLIKLAAFVIGCGIELNMEGSNG